MRLWRPPLLGMPRYRPVRLLSHSGTPEETGAGNEGAGKRHAVKKTLSRVMLSGSEASGLTRRAAWPTSDSSLPLRMTCPGHFFMACHKKTLSHVMLSAAKHPRGPD